MVPGYGGACVHPGRDASSANAADSRKVELDVSRCDPPITSVERRSGKRIVCRYDSKEWGVAWAWAWHQDVPASATNRSTSSTLVANEGTKRTRVASPSIATSFVTEFVVHG